MLTLISCVSANGDYIPPLLIYEGKTIDSGYFDYDFNFVLSTNDNAYMVKDIFREWCKHFISCVKPTAQLPALLILDNFGGHLEYIGFELLHSNNLHLAGLPPDTAIRFDRFWSPED